MQATTPTTHSSQPKPTVRGVDVGHYETLAGRFAARVHQTDGCWLWTGSTDSHGYGRMTVRVRGQARCLRAHQVSWLLRYGELPGHLMVLHNCPGGDNPLCVNPAHLWLGTQRDNMRDASAKGRARGGVRGERNSGARLTSEQVLAIRRAHAEGVRGIDLARTYNVTPETIRHITHRITWKHI